MIEENYGTEITVEDLGGYIVVVDEECIKVFKEEILKGTISEHIDDIEGDE